MAWNPAKDLSTPSAARMKGRWLVGSGGSGGVVGVGRLDGFLAGVVVPPAAAAPQRTDLAGDAHKALGQQQDDEESAQNQRPEVGHCGCRLGLEGVDPDGADDGPQGCAPAPDRHPDNGFEGFFRRHFTGVDDAHLRHIKGAAEARDDRAQGAYEKFVVRGRVTAEQNPVDPARTVMVQQAIQANAMSRAGTIQSGLARSLRAAREIFALSTVFPGRS